MRKVFLLLILSLLFINLVSSQSYYSDCSIYGNCKPIISNSINSNYTFIDVNNSQYLQGYTPTTLKDWFDTLYSERKWNYNQSLIGYNLNSSYGKYWINQTFGFVSFVNTNLAYRNQSNTFTKSAGNGSILSFSGTMTDTASGAVIFVSGNNGIAPPTNSLSDYRAFTFQNSPNSPYSLNSMEGGYFEGARYLISQSGNIGTIKGVFANGVVTTTACLPNISATNIYGIQAIGIGRNSGSGQVNSSFVFGGQFQSISGGAGIIINSFGISISSPASAGTYTNNYGLHIADQSLVGVNNYSIYSLGGKVYFKDNVGIGKTIPSNKLDVMGNINSSGEIYVNNGDAISPWLYNQTILPTGITINITILKDVDLVGLTKTYCDLNFTMGVLTSTSC